jgi:hypothetical protein
MDHQRFQPVEIRLIEDDADVLLRHIQFSKEQDLLQSQ